jgi:signal peptide peptidase SppA
MNNYHNVINAFYNQPWAIWPEKFDTLDAVLQLRLRGERSPDEERFKAEFEAAAERRQTRTAGGGVAVIPIVGMIMQRAGMFEASGGVSTQTIKSQITAAMNNSAVGSLVFDMDTPGGEVAGTPELSDFIFASRGIKPMIGVVNSFTASAGVFLGSQFDEVVITPSGMVGSIGVMFKHVDISALNEKMGVKVTTVTNDSSPHKGSTNPNEPISEAAMSELKGLANHFGDMFEKAVAKGRGVSVAKVRKDFGGGRMFSAKEAVSIGLVDRIGTLDETIARAAKMRTPRGPRTQTRRMRLALAKKG